MALTDIATKNAKSKSKTYKMFDGGGLYLEVTVKGGKRWRFKYRLAGKEKRFYSFNSGYILKTLKITKLFEFSNSRTRTLSS